MRRVTEEQLRKAEAKFKADYGRSEGSRERRNEAIRQARAQGWSLQRIADVTGLTRGRLSQIIGGNDA